MKNNNSQYDECLHEGKGPSNFESNPVEIGKLFAGDGPAER